MFKSCRRLKQNLQDFTLFSELGTSVLRYLTSY